MRARGPALNKLGTKPPVNPFGCPDDALRWRAEKADEHLIVTYRRSTKEVADMLI
jgi:hypothetical protein